MAYNFVRASKQWIDVEAPSLSSQMTIAAWVRQTTPQSGGFPNGYQILMRQLNSSQNINYAMFIRNGLVFEWTIGNSAYRAVSLGITNDTEWHHYCAAINWSNGTYSLSQDGAVTSGTFTISAPQTGSYATAIGRQNAVNEEYMNGDIAEVAIWDTKISDSEITSLGKGFLPPVVRPQNLLRYWPLNRNLVELKQSSAVINNTATVANHPRVYA